MTALRPERDSGRAGDQGSSYGQPYGDSGAFGGGWDGWYEDPGPAPGPTPRPPLDDETVALRVPPPATAPDPAPSSDPTPAGASAVPPPTGGRAARRKAAKRRHGRRAARAGTGVAPGAEEAPKAPLSRVEARRRARARRPSAAVIASRVMGELFITTGVLMLLFVTYQLWWTNVRAQAQADKAASNLQEDWANGKRSPGAFEPGQGFALLHIPKLDVVVPIAEGIDEKKVLDRGMVGHYAEGALKTAMPDAKTGNFGLAATATHTASPSGTSTGSSRATRSSWRRRTSTSSTRWRRSCR